MTPPPGREPDPDRPLPAQQPRSQATVDRLLAAAEALLREGGAEAATLRAIAERAGVSLGIVYRRFPDKDAVLRAVYVRFFERGAEANRRSFANPAVAGMPLAALAAALVAGMAHAYRAERDLLRALVLYARTHEDPEFRARADALNAVASARVGELFASRAAEMDHPDPATAIPFAIALAASTLQAQVLFGDAAGDVGVLPHDRLVPELTRAVRRYLGVRDAERSAG
jgi:AcrR family transcriptional regulator